MKNRKIMAMPVYCFFSVIGTLVLGILIGSFCDFNINIALENKTDLGTFFANYGSYFSYCLFPAAGTCLYMGLKKKDRQSLGKILFFCAYFLAVYYSNSYNGKAVRALFGYTAGESAAYLSFLAWLFWVILYAWVPVVCFKVIDDKDPDHLIAVGASILIAAVLADCTYQWLKQVASRPRYKYLITLSDPMSEFRNWWQMVPNLAGNNDNFKSWPSGHMTIAAAMFSLPMITDVCKKSSSKKNTAAFVFACIFVMLYAYNRIHMASHFLSDVCFGTLFSYLTYAAISHGFLKYD